jgi:hypothetical protein
MSETVHAQYTGMQRAFDMTNEITYWSVQPARHHQFSTQRARVSLR